MLLLSAGACMGGGSARQSYQIALLDDGQHCGAGAGTLRIDDVSAPGAMDRLFAAMPHGAEGHLTNVAGTDLRYRCLGGAPYELQRRGVKRIGFISEPPRDEAHR